MALSLVECMKNLASQGKTIICTIHQPSSEIFQLFDRLCLLAEGSLAYLGDLNMANSFFSTLDFKCPLNYNPADYYIQTLAISPFDKENCEERVNLICDNFDKSELMMNLKKSIEDSKQNPVAKIFSDTYEVSPYKVNSFKQFGWLTWRNVIDIVRNPMQTKIQFIQTLV
jgi:ATP-binding cassette, subfamily G (WHITE), eye pigment precursor transporter